MRNYLCPAVFLVVMFFSFVSAESDSIAIKGIYNYNYHLEYFKMDEFNDIYTQDKLIPGIGQFYHSNDGFQAELTYEHFVNNNSGNWLFTCGYSSHELKEDFLGVVNTFGENLHISKIFILFGTKKNLQNGKTAVYISTGPVINLYSGITDYDYVRYEFDYKPSVTYRIDCGMEYHISQNIYGNIGLAYDFGRIYRDNVEVYLFEEWAATYEPTEQQWIRDDQILLSFGLSYKYSWEKE